jgi:N6-L-threonylcarbamoyladenine synthase
MNILGIETSCDETAAAVVQNGTHVLSSMISSQVEVHHLYGGVVPELASRKHIEAIVPVVAEAINDSGLEAKQIDAVAATRGPGLVEPGPPPFPFVALLASGGHTGIYYVTSHTAIELMGQTRDDAAGEAFDKVAKLLGLGYPGGTVIDRLSKEGDPTQIIFPRPYLNKSDFDFSFSGIKTAVSLHIGRHPTDSKTHVADIAAGFQEAVVEVLAYKIINAALKKGCEHIAVVGGVAANSGLRRQVRLRAERQGLEVHIPSVQLCGDNAAMIAAAGYHYLNAGIRAKLSDDVFSKSK